MKFNFRALTQSAERLNVISTKLGATKAEVFTDKDLKKPMVMGKKGNMVIAAAGAEIEGFLDNIDAGPTADGHVFGGVARCNAGTRMEVEIEGAADVLGLVVAGATPAVGLQSTTKLGVVKAGAPVTHKWRIISLANDAEAAVGGEIAVIEKL